MNLSYAEGMCSTGFAIAYADEPADQIVLWTGPFSARATPDQICDLIVDLKLKVADGGGIGCFVASNPYRVVPKD